MSASTSHAFRSREVGPGGYIRPAVAASNLFSPIPAFPAAAATTTAATAFSSSTLSKFHSPPIGAKMLTSSPQSATAAPPPKSSPVFPAASPQSAAASAFSKAFSSPSPISQSMFLNVGTFVVGAYSLQTLNSCDLPIGLPLRVMRDEVKLSDKQSLSSKLKFGKKPDSIVRLASQRHGAFGRIVTGIARHLSFLIDMKHVCCTQYNPSFSAFL
jgi:hypothetical protein